MKEKVKNILWFVLAILEYIACLLLGHVLVNFMVDSDTLIGGKVIAGVFLAIILYAMGKVVKCMTMCAEDLKRN